MGLFYKSIDIYYDCLEKQKYVTVTIRKTFLGAELQLGNGIYLYEHCNDCGILASQNYVYGYAIFDYGYIVFGGPLKQTHFGYCLFESENEKESKHVSTFCIFPPFTEQNLKDKIQLLKNGEQK